MNNLKQQLADAKSKIDGLEKQLEEKQRHIVELEGKLKVRPLFKLGLSFAIFLVQLDLRCKSCKF